VNLAKKRRELTDMILLQVPIQEQAFPILVRWRNSQHRQQVILRVFKHESRNRVWRASLGSQRKAMASHDFGMGC